MSDLNNQINMSDISTILEQVQAAHADGRINNEQYSNIIKTFIDVLNLVINNSSIKPVSSEVPENRDEPANTEISGGFLNQLMAGGSIESNDDTSVSTLNYNEDDTVDHEISLKGGYDYLYNPTKKNKFTPTASYHAKKSLTNTNTALNKQIKQESDSLTGGALNNYFNKLIESTLKSKKVKGGDAEEDEFDGGAKKRKACKKKKAMKGGEEDSDESEKEETENKDEVDEEKEDENKEDEEKEDENKEDEDKPITNIDIDDDTEEPKKEDKKEDEVHIGEESEEELDEMLDDEGNDDVFEGGKSQLQPYHDKIVENITKYLDKYEPELTGEDKELKGKQIKRLLNVLYYKSDENTSMEDRIKQLEDIGDKTSTEAKLKKIITSNKDELQSIIDSWVKAEPKKKNKKNKKPKKFNDETAESIEIKKNKKEATESNTESSINGNIVDTASMIDSVIMGGRKKTSLKRNLFNY